MIPVKDLYQYLRMMLDGHWGYIYGTDGIRWTQTSQDAATNEMTRRYGWQWVDHMVTDCSGVMVYIWKKFGLTIPHGSNSMVRQKYIVDISNVPQAGYAALVYKAESNDYAHIGIVGEDGETVYEAKGTQYGFVTSKVTDKKWNRFGRFKDVDYSGKEVKPMETPYWAKVHLSSGYLNMRSGPSTDDAVVACLYDGDNVKVITHGDKWDFVQAETKQGYVANKYLYPTENVREDDTITNYGVLIPCDTKEDAEKLASYFENAEVINGKDD